MEENREFLSPRLLVGFLSFIFLAAFALNFVTLSEYAAGVINRQLMFHEVVEFAKPSALPYAFPFLVDAFLVMATVIVLRNSSVGETSYLAWGIIAVTTVVAVALNALHYEVWAAWQAGDYTTVAEAGLYSIIVPGVILGSSELGKGLMNSVQKRSGFVARTAELQAEHATAEVQLDELSAQLKTQNEALNAAREAHNAQLAEGEQALERIKLQVQAARAELEEARLLQSTPAIEWVQALQIDALRFAGHTHKAACETVGLSENTGRARLAMLNGEALYKP